MCWRAAVRSHAFVRAQGSARAGTEAAAAPAARCPSPVVWFMHVACSAPFCNVGAAAAVVAWRTAAHAAQLRAALRESPLLMALLDTIAADSIVRHRSLNPPNGTLYIRVISRTAAFPALRSCATLLLNADVPRLVAARGAPFAALPNPQHNLNE